MHNIAKLKEHPEFIPAIIDAIWDEWSEDYIKRTNYKTKKDLENLYFQITQNDANIPDAYIIFDTDTIIGSCLIDVEDMGVYPECPGPWLANVYIMKEWRNQGYATKLLEYVVPRYQKMHLWTFNMKLAQFYERFGFIVKEIISEKCILCEK
jgi:GNAT superfamily N-acetyltransferase